VRAHNTQELQRVSSGQAGTWNDPKKEDLGGCSFFVVWNSVLLGRTEEGRKWNSSGNLTFFSTDSNPNFSLHHDQLSPYALRNNATPAKLSFLLLLHDIQKMAVFWDVAPCSHGEIHRRCSAHCLRHQGDEIAPMMKAVTTSETSVNIYETRCSNIPECHLLSRRRENLKSAFHETRFEVHFSDSFFRQIVIFISRAG
jgi:hypothetical protein